MPAPADRPLFFSEPDPLMAADAWAWLLARLAEQVAAEPIRSEPADRRLLAGAAKDRR